jgi:hypothetical protein
VSWITTHSVVVADGLPLLETLDSLLDLLRRLPPTRIEENVNTLCDLAPEYADDLLGNVDQPLKVLRDEGGGREFLGCDYNRDGDSFRLALTCAPRCFPLADIGT